jgi:hypothetical protein
MLQTAGLPLPVDGLPLPVDVSVGTNCHGQQLRNSTLQMLREPAIVSRMCHGCSSPWVVDHGRAVLPDLQPA